MKKLLFAAALTLVGLGAFAQNIQLHYDFTRSDKNSKSIFTSTVEMFKPDSYGSTFFFIDMNYGEGDVKGVSLSYWEIARSLKFWKAPVGIHVEYNAGHGMFKGGSNFTDYSGFNINPAWLLGVDYSWNNANFSRGVTLQAMYKHIEGFGTASFQLTGVWYMHLLNNKVTFSGFADLWKQTQFGNKLVFLSEPQLWYNFNKNFSVGSEIEISKNFISPDFEVYPTAAIKWNF
jgi:hypothetical protein